LLFLFLFKKALWITFGWFLYSIGCLLYGIKYQKEAWKLTAVVLLLLTTAKLFLLDLATVPLVVRSALFILVGSIEILASRFYYEINSRK
jgi:uncharacterized membrane protein